MNQDKHDHGNPPAPLPPPEKPEILELRVEKLVTGGAGLARHEKGTTFVPLTAPGDLVRVVVEERRKGFARGALQEVLEPGPDRADPPCPHFGTCGGCDLQHLTPAAQRAAKAAIVVDCFRRLGKLDVAELVTGPTAGAELGYRNRIRLHAHPTGHYGLRRRGSHDVVPLDSCPLLLDQFNDDILPWLRMLPPVDQIVVRLDGRGNWLAALFGPAARLKMFKRILAALPDGDAPAPGCVGLLFNNRPVWGRDHLIHEVAGHMYRVGAQGFFQGNHAAAGEVVATVRTWLQELRDADRLGALLGDFFCGAGLFTLALADYFDRVVAVEMDPGGVHDARNNIQRDAATRDKATVHEGPLATVLAQPDLAADELWASSLCLVDPPRTGLGKEGVGALLQRRPRHILYLSCDPATLARDAAALVTDGYIPRRLQVVDMFPQTAHVECLLLLEESEPDQS